MAKAKSQIEADKEAETEAQHRERVAAIARETMTGDLRDCIPDFLKHNNNPLPWNVQGEGAQRDTVEKAPVDIKADQGNLIDGDDDDGSVFDKTPAGRH